MTQLLVFTDLDGTLLNHEDYSYAAAADALASLHSLGIPLILNSSKTCAEVLPLQDELGLAYPLICENGAVIYQREDNGSVSLFAEFACSREAVLDVLGELREEYQFQFRGFADLSLAAIAEVTGLTPEQAQLAARREYSEPLIWEDSEQRMQQFAQALLAQGLVAQQGGRFLTVAGRCDKGQAMLAVQRWYAQHGEVTTVALGDSPNDLPMLQAADIACVIQSLHSAAMNVAITSKGSKRVIRSKHPGAAGWQETMASVLGEIQHG